ncbi:UDP-N-acetylmuramyl tripeptide synthase [Legionella rubrilucens]|uniref:UDP-N-acetylmuramyl tripeptide synthase n=1 Tax=Legionella rubrilucens TaxID=458 RepID=A0A0W0XLS9_9GAMM|nr:UDP-N-acetylmuramyl peptide synthase [Legionella rubrilucens]KTD45557.1 UDP-N-acetylmuramyl tripeptide synthase [Legionella rubrilucens]
MHASADLNYNKNTLAYYQSAKELLLPAELVEDIEGVAIHLGKRTYYFRGGETPFNSSCSANIASNKYCANKILERAGIPVPKATAIHVDDFYNGLLEQVIADLKFPLVVKPSKEGRLGRDVVCNIQNIEQLKAFMDDIFPAYDFLSIEEFHGNLNSYRVLMFRQRILGVVRRYAAHVIGDGQHTIRELVELANADRARLSDTLKPIQIDGECLIRLEELGLTINDIPQLNERVDLCYTCNATRGGTYETIKTRVCRENRRLLKKAVATLNLAVVGLDIECVDLTIPIEESGGVIIEANPAPSVRIHETPQKGKARQVTKIITRSLIYRHPLSYLHVLYKHNRTAFYVRSLILLPILYFLYRQLI